MNRVALGAGATTAALFACALWACVPDLKSSIIAFCGDGKIDLSLGEQCDHGLGPNARPPEESACSASCQVKCPVERNVDAGAGATLTLGRSSENGHCYFLPGTPSQDGTSDTSAARSFDEARAMCQGRAANLVSIGSAAEARLVAELVAQAAPQEGQNPQSARDRNFWVSLKWAGDKVASDGGAHPDGEPPREGGPPPIESEAFYTSAGLGEPGAGAPGCFYQAFYPALDSVPGEIERCIQAHGPIREDRTLYFDRSRCRITESTTDAGRAVRIPLAVCERQVDGSRAWVCPRPNCNASVPCNDICFTVFPTYEARLANPSIGSPKQYRLIPDAVTEGTDDQKVTPLSDKDVPQSRCEQANGRLAIIESAAEREAIWEVIRREDPNIARLWIGLRAKRGTAGSSIEDWYWGETGGSPTPLTAASMNPFGTNDSTLPGTRAYLAYDGAEHDSQLARYGTALRHGNGWTYPVRAYPLCEVTGERVP